MLSALRKPVLALSVFSVVCFWDVSACCRADNPIVERFASIEVTGLTRAVRVTETVFSGEEPTSKETFADLFRHGVRTIVSVDGAKPNVGTANACGIRYVHIPVGYDTIDSFAKQSIVQVIRETKAPIYVHCHHGRHRGPAAAAIAGIASGLLTKQQAIAFLQQAGTGEDYRGLWDAVQDFEPSQNVAPAVPLVESAEVPTDAEAMAEIGRAFDRLETKLLCDNETASVPKVRELHELAVLIVEGLKEFQRHRSIPSDQLFMNLLLETQVRANEVAILLQSNRIPNAMDAARKLSDDCEKCHDSYRN